MSRKLASAPAVASRSFPDGVLPMLATAAPYPANEGEYAFEPKWDGYRAIAYLREGRVTLRSRNLNDLTDEFPELAGLATALGGRRAVLDGEIVALDESGRPSFQLLQNRLGVTHRGRAKRDEGVPIAYIVFDILHLDGQDTMPLAYEERRRILEALPLRGDRWRVSPSVVGDGHVFLEMPGWEGVVAKRLGSRYEPGARSRAWLKIKTQKRQELVIAGWTPGRGSRAGGIGALVVGYYDGDVLRYAGKVGTGFTEKALDALHRLLAPTVRQTSPFGERIAEIKDATFVEPRYVAEFEFTEWTSDGRLRHPSYKGLRDDKDPRDVTREEM